MTKDELREKRKRAIESLNDIKVILELDELYIDELECQKNRNKSCYSCANATERCFRNEIGCPCEKYKSWKEENAELKKACDKTQELLDKQIEATFKLDKENTELRAIAENQQSSNMERYFKNKDLEKENAELKSRECWKSCEYANPKSELIAQHIKDIQQLTKAIEIIKEILEEDNYSLGLPKELRLKTEQFIKDSEVEK